MTDDADNVQRLPVRFKKAAPEERTLLFPHEVGKRDKCYHEQFVVDQAKAEVECGTCGERLNPMWVLQQLTARDSRFHDAHRIYNETMKRLDERVRTKCDHCGKMTRIRRR